MESVASAPLLIIEGFGMRKLPLTGAEDLLKIIMGRYDRVSADVEPQGRRLLKAPHAATLPAQPLGGLAARFPPEWKMRGRRRVHSKV